MVCVCVCAGVCVCVYVCVFADGAMRDSNRQFSTSFYAKFFSCVICSLLIVGMAFAIMNSWLGVRIHVYRHTDAHAYGHLCVLALAMCPLCCCRVRAVLISCLSLMHATTL